jgi:hypothetical protein
MSVFTAGGETVRMSDLGGANDSFVNLSGSQFQRAYIGADGSATNVALQIGGTKGTGQIVFATGPTGLEQARVAHTASAVNYLQVTGATTGNSPSIQWQGSDTNIQAAYLSKGTGAHSFFSGSGARKLFQITDATNAVNFGELLASAAGAAPAFRVQGSDTNIDLALTPKGTGLVRFGTYTAGALSIAGYVEIKDSGGTIRRLAVVA